MINLQSSQSNPQLEIAAKRVLRNYLVRCHSLLSKEYPPVSSMEPEQAADHLIGLRDAGKIEISLNTVDDLIHCKISHLH
jgi:hypothetical protein